MELYFAGGPKKLYAITMAQLGANRLQSQLLDKTGIKRWCNLKDQYPEAGKLMIDSGAHTAFYTGQALDVDAYIDYLNEIDNYVAFSIQADIVPGSGGNEKYDFNTAPKVNWDNYLYMRSKLKSPDKLMPVFHIGEDFKWLRNMLDWRGPDGERVTYIGIAPRQEDSWETKINFMRRCFEVILSSTQPDVRTHVLGMTNLSVLEMFPFTSADSSTWIMSAATGGIITPWGAVPISYRTQKYAGHYDRLPPEGKKRIQEHVEKYGYTIKQLQESLDDRAIFNLIYVLDWVKNYRCKAIDLKPKKRLF